MPLPIRAGRAFAYIAVGWLVGISAPVLATSVLLDAGTGESALMGGGFQHLAPSDVYDTEKDYGWDAAEGMRAYVKSYEGPIENRSRGTKEPPPIYTTPLTEDCLIGSAKRTLRVDVPAGDYGIYVLCGASQSMRSQYFDFFVAAGDARERVRIEGGHTFRSARLSAKTDGKPLSIVFDPASKWVMAAVMVWDKSDAERVEAVIAKTEDQLRSLPPEVMAKWKFEPRDPGPGLPESELAKRGREAGFVVFHRPYVENVYPNTRPRAHELAPELRVFASPGEYEPLTFTLRTVESLRNVTVKPSSIAPVSAKTLGPAVESIDVRHVRYMKARPNYRVQGVYRIVPDVLESFSSLDLPAGESHRFWLTLHVPDDAKPGHYSGTVAVSCDRGAERQSVEIPVKLRVLDIHLREDPDKLYGIYYRDPIDRWRGATDQVSKDYFLRKSEMEHADMAAHGIRNVILSAWCRPENAEGKFEADWTTLKMKLEMARKHAFRPPFVVSINTGGVYQKHMKERYGSHLRGVKIPPQAFFDEMTRMAAFVESERVKNGWPEFLYYPVDEPGRNETAVQFMTKLLEAIRKAGVRTYVTADPTHEVFAPMRSHVNVWCTQPFAPDRETVLADMVERDVEYWCYPNHVNGENDHTPVAGARMTYGFGFWRSGFKTLTPWIYSSSSGDPYNYLDGAAMDFFNRHEEDGTPVPVAMWEAYREGYDDYRYVYTLGSLIAETRAAEREREADRAQAVLDRVWKAIQVQEKYKYDGLWAPEEFDVYRWLIARAILEIQGKPAN